MGGSQSNEQRKDVDTAGQVNNNVVVAFDNLQDSADDYGLEIVILLLKICVLKVFEFINYVYINHIKKPKKKYGNN